MALTGCTQITDTIGGDTVRVIVPDTYVSNPGAYQVVYHHGAGDSNDGVNNPVVEDTIQLWIDAGYLVASSDAADDNWGNQASLDAYADLDEWVRASYTVRGTAIYSGSMGGCSGLLCATNDTYSDLRGWVGIFPVCSLAAMFDNNNGALAGGIRAAYGIAVDGSDYAALTAGHDPLLVASASYPNIPYRFFASASDTVVGKTANSDAFATWLGTGRPEKGVVVCSGDHGDTSHFQAQDVIDFLHRCFDARSIATRYI